jgi:hypothetical protein
MRANAGMRVLKDFQLHRNREARDVWRRSQACEDCSACTCIYMLGLVEAAKTTYGKQIEHPTDDRVQLLRIVWRERLELAAMDAFGEFDLEHRTVRSVSLVPSTRGPLSVTDDSAVWFSSLIREERHQRHSMTGPDL